MCDGESFSTGKQESWSLMMAAITTLAMIFWKIANETKSTDNSRFVSLSCISVLDLFIYLPNYLIFPQARRSSKFMNTCSPGPSQYAIPRTLNTRKDFNQHRSSAVFHQPIAHSLSKDTGPAPNQYEVEVAFLFWWLWVYAFKIFDFFVQLFSKDGRNVVFFSCVIIL